MGSRSSGDYARILSGTAANVAGIGCAAVAILVVQVLMTRTLGREEFGVVTVLTQAAFVVSFATRSGMDMAVLRTVAIHVGENEIGPVRSLVARATAIAGAVSAFVAVLVALAAEPISSLVGGGAATHRAVLAAAVGLPFLATANVWLAATRGLKLMRYTLYVFWAGQNAVWILLTLLLWLVEASAATSVLAYSLSWAWAAGAAWWSWRREAARWPTARPARGWLEDLLRYSGPRAPAAFLAQMLFWIDLFVLTQFAGGADVGVYSAALRAGQVVMLFLTSVNMMFAPFVADLYNRGEREHLDRLYKTLTRWILAGTLPVFLLIALAPEAVMRIFGRGFAVGTTALLILTAGQLANIATGSAGFILVMVGRTGWDLVVYACSVALDIALALWLCPRYGIEGAAVANAVTLVASNCARLLAVRRFVAIQPYDHTYARLAGPALLCGLAMWGADALAGDAGYLPDLVGMGVVGGAVYAAAYLAIGLSPQERRGAAALWARARDRSARSMG
ncbi:MAG TPA: flippase [Actinomycetota bacterium]|nr:flippase [Actinomycetota bacterium]